MNEITMDKEDVLIIKNRLWDKFKSDNEEITRFLAEVLSEVEVELKKF